MDKIIEVSGLKKNYGLVQAVKGVDFYVERGKLFAFLGPNGAGKSTTIDILCTLLKGDEGKVVIDGKTLGKEDHKIRDAIGVVFQDSVLDPLLTVKENLYSRGRFYGLKGAVLHDAVIEAAKVTGVMELFKRPYGKLSGGQRRRVDIARALVHTPKILFLDEPTTGLDPQTRKSVWETVQALQREKGMTVFLTTHYMEEAATADYIIVINEGNIVAKGTPSELRQVYSSDQIKLHTAHMEEIKGYLDQTKADYVIKDTLVTINLKNTLEGIPILEDCKQWVTNVEIQNGTMDDAFINITGREGIE